MRSVRQADPAPLDHTLVAASLLRLGGDTRGARLFQEVVLPVWRQTMPDVRPSLVERLADALGLEGRDRQRRLGEVQREAARAIHRAKDRAFGLTSVLDRTYPSRLSQIPDPPIVLWSEGQTDALHAERMVAVVGSRNATPGGLSVATRLAGELASAGITVVSGLARGIDGAAHQGAIDARGQTVAVVGNGLDVTYPRQHAALARRVVEHGAIVSEFPPGTPPLPDHFPLRNRIISGLSRAVVVVEASEKSGSLITARAALEQGREVFAVPGNVASGCYRGCHALIKDGARLVETVHDVLEELGWDGRKRHGGKSHAISGLELVMPIGESLTTDELAARSGRRTHEILAELAALELDGRVGRGVGGTFTRLDGSGTNRES